jgi:uncharacterized membrane protein
VTGLKHANHEGQVKKRYVAAFCVGIAVAGFLTRLAYYSNSHPGAKQVSPVAYLVLFLPSVSLMVVNGASRAVRIAVTIFSGPSKWGLLLSSLAVVTQTRGTGREPVSGFAEVRKRVGIIGN